MLSLSRWTRTSTPRSCEIVLEILQSSHPTPLSSQALYQRIRKDYAHEKIPIPALLPEVPPDSRLDASKRAPKNSKAVKAEVPLPPHPDHPIRSLKYLKDVVLKDLVTRQQIEKVHTMREPTAEELQRAKGRSSKKAKKGKDNTLRPVLINVKGMIDQWGWMLTIGKSRAEGKHEQDRIQKAIEGQNKPDPKLVEQQKKKEFLETWGHLNARRQRARVGKLERENKWASLLERGRQEGMTEAEQAAS